MAINDNLVINFWTIIFFSFIWPASSLFLPPVFYKNTFLTQFGYSDLEKIKIWQFTRSLKGELEDGF